MGLELISLVPVTLLWVSNVHLDYWNCWGGEIGQLRKRWNEEDEEIRRGSIYLVISISFTYSQ